MTNSSKKAIAAVCILIAMAVLRVLHAEYHIYNLLPVAALGVFSGSIFQQKRLAYLMPIAVMFLSDIGLSLFTNVQGFYGISQVVNYAALILITYIGTFLTTPTVRSVAGFTLSSSLLFFIISNFGTFLSGYYGYSFSSLMTCYLMAIPFYKSELATTFFVNSVVGDMIFSFVAFGIVYAKRILNLRPQPIN
jgi:hypothetical protein